MLGLPTAAMSVARIAAVNSVADTNVVGRIAPLTRTTEALVKFVPVAVSAKSPPPIATLAGAILVSVGASGGDCTSLAGLDVLGAVILRLALFDIHTPLVQDAWFATWTTTAPWVTTSVASSAILTCVVESTITVRAWPPTVAVAPAANPAPVAVRMKAPLPAVTLAGLRLLMLGVGLTLATVSGRAPDVPPPGAGVDTVMLGIPATAISLAGMAAVSCVDETNVVVRPAPLTWTIELFVKLEPVAVRVKAAPPADAAVGLMLDRTGAGVGAAMVKARELEVPPLEPGVDTLI